MLTEQLNDSTIVIGQNKHENEQIVKEAKKDGISFWFHLKNIPSAHAILTPKEGTKKPSTKSFRRAAYLVKITTDKKLSSKKIDVTWTSITNVEPQKNPGQVKIHGDPKTITI